MWDFVGTRGDSTNEAESEGASESDSDTRSNSSSKVGSSASSEKGTTVSAPNTAGVSGEIQLGQSKRPVTLLDDGNELLRHFGKAQLLRPQLLIGWLISV